MLSDPCSEIDDLFYILRNNRRRIIIRYLDTVTDASTDDLARTVAAVQNGIAKEDVSSQQRKTVLTSLLQTHLDALESLQIIEWTNGTVKPGPLYEDVKDVLDYADQLRKRFV